ncbi:J domain-containing protein [Baaleninema sp.]|uniref:J domain-containing protein n=1 Tax=Baaleninema sp. TaxID=3101197 RepID=UPI003D01490E
MRNEPNHYEVLKVDRSATQAEIKQAYRRLVKLFHPDRNPDRSAKEAIVQINAAYEVLGDRSSRQSYDRRRDATTARSTRHARSKTASTSTANPRTARKTSRSADELVAFWLQRVYRPIDFELDRILEALDPQIDELSADPFDDELMENFAVYLSQCRVFLDRAQNVFRSTPNPSSLAGVAADIYHCLNQVHDGLEELEYFTLNYDDRHLHVGRELFRMARGLQEDAYSRIQHIL